VDSLPGIVALSQACADHPGQHIASPGGGQARIAAGVDTRDSVGLSDHSARALQHHHGPKTLGQPLRLTQAVRLDFLCGTALQACGFQRVRREDGGKAPGTSLAQQVLQRGVLRNGIERIRVQDQTFGGGQQTR